MKAIIQTIICYNGRLHETKICILYTKLRMQILGIKYDSLVLHWTLCTRVYKIDQDKVSIQVFSIMILNVGKYYLWWWLVYGLSGRAITGKNNAGCLLWRTRLENMFSLIFIAFTKYPEHQLCPSSVQVLCKLIQSLRLVLRLFKVFAEFSVTLEFVTDGSAGL